MRKGGRKINVDNTNKEVKGKSGEEEYIKIPKCIRKIHVETINEDRIRGRVDWWIKVQNCLHLKRNKTSKFFVGITKKKEFIIYPELFDANNIFSHLFIQNIKHKTNMVQYLSRKIKRSL